MSNAHQRRYFISLDMQEIASFSVRRCTPIATADRIAVPHMRQALLTISPGRLQAVGQRIYLLM
jgi:hypothetical protein